MSWGGGGGSKFGGQALVSMRDLESASDSGHLVHGMSRLYMDDACTGCRNPCAVGDPKHTHPRVHRRQCGTGS